MRCGRAPAGAPPGVASRASVAVASAFASRTAVDDPLVLVGDPAQELAALEQLGEALGLQDDGHEVGLLGLVELDEAAWPAPAADDLQPRAQADEPRALGAQVDLRGLEPRLRLAPRSAWTALWRRCRASIRAVEREICVVRTRSVPFLRADLALLGLDLALQAVELRRGEAPSDGRGRSAHASRGNPAQSRRIVARRTVTSGRNASSRRFLRSADRGRTRVWQDGLHHGSTHLLRPRSRAPGPDAADDVPARRSSTSCSSPSWSPPAPARRSLVVVGGLLLAPVLHLGQARAARAMGAHVGHARSRRPSCTRMIERLCVQADLPKPKVAVIETVDAQRVRDGPLAEGRDRLRDDGHHGAALPRRARGRHGPRADPRRQPRRGDHDAWRASSRRSRR